MTLKHEKTKQILYLLWYMLLWLHSGNKIVAH
jgi:hypothetical protein